MAKRDYYEILSVDRKDDDYKTFIKRMMLSMIEGDKWEKLSELNDLTEKIKNHND